MKRVKTVLPFAMVVLLGGVALVQADTFNVSGAGTQVVEHVLSTPIGPGETISATIVNGKPGYTNFLVYISGPDGAGNEVIGAAALRKASDCAAPTGCTITLTNNSGVWANELTVVGSGGKGSSASASVSHLP